MPLPEYCCASRFVDNPESTFPEGSKLVGNLVYNKDGKLEVSLKWV